MTILSQIETNDRDFLGNCPGIIKYRESIGKNAYFETPIVVNTLFFDGRLLGKRIKKMAVTYELGSIIVRSSGNSTKISIACI